MTFQERARFADTDGVEYVNILQVESGYDRNILAADWDADPKLESAKIAEFLNNRPPDPVVKVDAKPPVEYTAQELTDALSAAVEEP